MKPKMFEIAKKLSYKSTSRFRLGCVIAYRNKPIGMGFNDMGKTHPKSPHYWKCLHAEIHALIGLSFEESKGCSAYVYRETKFGQPVNAKPCPSCEAALRLAGIKRVFYTHEEGPKELSLK